MTGAVDGGRRLEMWKMEEDDTQRAEFKVGELVKKRSKAMNTRSTCSAPITKYQAGRVNIYQQRLSAMNRSTLENALADAKVSVPVGPPRNAAPNDPSIPLPILPRTPDLTAI